MVFSKKVYGIKVRFSSGHWEEYWYGFDKGLRARKHNEYVRMANVVVVQDISKKA